MATRRAASGADEWQPVCDLADLEVGRGATALAHGQALAIFRLDRRRVFVLGNHDPFAHTSTLARGLVGQRGGVPFVGSPAHGHRFDLRTGRCLDDPHVSVPVYAVRVARGRVLVGPRCTDAARPASSA